MRRKKIKKLSQADKGRAILKEQKAENVSAISGFDIDEMVQYYDDGWRVGRIREMPVRGKNRGLARVEHLLGKRKVWVTGSSLKKMEA